MKLHCCLVHRHNSERNLHYFKLNKVSRCSCLYCERCSCCFITSSNLIACVELNSYQESGEICSLAVRAREM